VSISQKATERFRDTYKGSGLVLPAIQRFVMRKSVNTKSDRSDTVIHPSEMCKSDWCPRHDYYRITGVPAEPVKRNPSFQMENVFTEGHRIHSKYQSWLWEMGILEGMWRCKSCDHYWWAIAPSACESCGHEKLRYREIPLVSEDLMIQGHADGGISDGGDWIELSEPLLLEFKTVGTGTLMFEAPALHKRYQDGDSLDNIWRDIKTPFATHLRQASLYWYLANGKYSKIVFVYECKWNQQVKEFVVTPDIKWIQATLDSAKEVAQGVRAGIVPYHPVWAKPDGKKCSSCPYLNTCWDIKHDPESPSVQTAGIKRSSAVRRKRALG
jgi:hypothetical protein